MNGRVPIVAGSYSGDGPGILDDIKMITELGSYAMVAITVLTVQKMLHDLSADAIKIGMLYSVSAIKPVAEVLADKAADVPIVLNPEMVAKGGSALVQDMAVFSLTKTHWLSRASNP